MNTACAAAIAAIARYCATWKDAWWQLQDRLVGPCCRRDDSVDGRVEYNSHGKPVKFHTQRRPS